MLGVQAANMIGLGIGSGELVAIAIAIAAAVVAVRLFGKMSESKKCAFCGKPLPPGHTTRGHLGLPACDGCLQRKEDPEPVKRVVALIGESVALFPVIEKLMTGKPLGVEDGFRLLAAAAIVVWLVAAVRKRIDGRPMHERLMEKAESERKADSEKTAAWRQ